ncbi:MAG: YfiM family protein [Saprospiraceae bacterium]|nr:YfiM family protein [Saprospiraceae bacterium]
MILGKRPLRLFAAWVLLCLCLQKALAQQSATPDSLYPQRLTWVLGLGIPAYGGATYLLYDTWYKNYQLGPFHTFNDWGEWRGMDKAGHLYATYAESEIAFRVAQWVGFRRNSAVWLGVGTGMLIQSTLEIMDGFSQKWGFSWPDMAFNIAGAGLFAAQELHWQEQRIRIKGSAWHPGYPEAVITSTDGQSTTSLQERGQDLFGQGAVQTFLKNYNATTVWLSINPSSFLATPSAKKFPAWLNIALGYGAGNLYGGHDNTWTSDSGAAFELSAQNYPRYSQFYLSLDLDLRRIPVNNRTLRTLLHSLNWLKIPAPTLEINTRGGVKGHLWHW